MVKIGPEGELDGQAAHEVHDGEDDPERAGDDGRAGVGAQQPPRRARRARQQRALPRRRLVEQPLWTIAIRYISNHT